MEREPLGKNNHFSRDEGRGSPWDLTKEGHHNSGKNITVCGTAMSQDQVFCTDHVFFMWIVADEFQGIVGLDGTA